jgi:hypothetical protein
MGDRACVLVVGLNGSRGGREEWLANGPRAIGASVGADS